MEEALVNGLIQTIVHDKTKGYEIFNYVCRKCHKEISYKKEDVTGKCGRCGGQLKYVSKIDEKTVQDIVSRKARYTCPRCEKVYDTAVDCCIAKENQTKELIVSEYGVPDRMTRGLI